MDIKEAIKRVVEGQDLPEQEMFSAMNQIMSGDATEAQIGSFITALRMKGETVEEIVGAVRVMREKATTIPVPQSLVADGVLLDTCGTGGDGAGTFNVSTTSAFVVAAADIPVAKHGNRSVSSPCGSADVLEALGVPITLSPEQVATCIEKVGIGFLYAPSLHGAMKYAAGPRKALAIRTIFNVLGPLTNPASANVQLLGVFSPELTESIAEVLGKLGSKRALVVHGEGNLDEISVSGSTRVTELRDGAVSTFSITPEEFSLERYPLEAISGGATVQESADLLKGVLQGDKGARRDVVLLNGGGALYAAGRCDTVMAGVRMAAELIDSGKALEKLTSLVRFASSLAAA